MTLRLGCSRNIRTAMNMTDYLLSRPAHDDRVATTMKLTPEPEREARAVLAEIQHGWTGSTPRSARTSRAWIGRLP
jgi:hypothetical protein